MPQFSALWHDILTSSIWGENDSTRIVFITMLAAADDDGIVHASVGGLAHLARVPASICTEALVRLTSPDPDSRTAEHEGRRVEIIAGGFKLLNWKKYQTPLEKKKPSDHRREYMRNYIAKRRKSQRAEKPEQAELPDVNVKVSALPTSPEALFICQLFNRRPTTVWNQKEVKAFRDAMRRGVLGEENRIALKLYYEQERGKGGDGIHRRDLLTFLNNIDGEIDRALSKCAAVAARNNTTAAHGTAAHPPTSAASSANSGTSNAKHASKY